MFDLIDELGDLRADALPPVRAEVVEADLVRGRRARRRRHLRLGITTSLAACLVGVGAVGVVGVGNGPGRASGSSAASGSVSPAGSPAPADATSSPLTLVAWTGAQPPGLTVEYVPAGFVVEGVSDSEFHVLPAGGAAGGSPDAIGIVVTLDDRVARPAAGAEAVVVGGGRGYFALEGADSVLTVDAAAGTLVVRAAAGLRLDLADLIRFAAGVTVTPGGR